MEQDHEPRIAVYLDYENLAIGARENLGVAFDFANVADALAERGRVIVRKAYADWSYFDKDRRMLTRHQVELTDIPQKMGGSRKNAADIKMAIDAVELALERKYISTFVICTGDSDLSPLVHKLREFDRTVIGVGVKGSTSNLLPPACDEFLFYDNLVDTSQPPSTERKHSTPGDLSLVITTLAGLEESTSGPVRGSALKRAILRKEPTFNEADLGFRGFGGLLRGLVDRDLVTLDGSGDPIVSIAGSGALEAADTLLTTVVGDAKSVPYTGLKQALLKADSSFSEANLGFRNFGSFVRSAEARDLIKVTGKNDDRVVKLVAYPIFEEAHVLFGSHIGPGLPASLLQVIVEFRFDAQSFTERQRGLVSPKHWTCDDMVDLFAAEIVANGLRLRDTEFAQRRIAITTGLGFVVRLAVADNEDVHGLFKVPVGRFRGRGRRPPARTDLVRHC